MNLCLKSVGYVVFDEADRLFELGFDEQLREILNRLPEDRQTLLFSATLPKSLVEFAQAGLQQPTLVRLDVDSKLSDKLTLAHFLCRNDDKMSILLNLLEKCQLVKNYQLLIIFCATKLFVEYVHEVLQRLHFNSTYLYSSMDPEARRINIEKFRRGQANILVVTDLAARGVDIPLLHTAINFHFPAKPKLFVHRVGRVARAGSPGKAISLLSLEEYPYLLDLYMFLGRNLRFASAKNAPEDSDVIGSFPESLVGAEDRAKLLTEQDADLLAMQRAAYRSLKRFNTCKPVCSSESVRRAKAETQLQNLYVHPMTVTIATTSGDLNTKRTDLLSGIRRYRPENTVVKLPSMKKLQKKEEMTEREKNDVQPEVAVEIPDCTKNIFSEIIRSKFFNRASVDQTKKKKKNKRKSDEKSDDCFIPYTAPDLHTELGLSVKRDAFALNAESAVVDFMHDDVDKVERRDKQMKWDRKRKRFVGKSGDEKKKRIKTESGAWISASYKSDAYNNWQRKLRFGAADDDENDGDAQAKRLNFFKSAPKGMQKGKRQRRSELKSRDQIFKSAIKREQRKSRSSVRRQK